MEEKIIQTARGLFALYGIKTVSMDKISKELRISKKTIYGYFGNKDELVYKVIETSLHELIQDVEKENSSENSPVKKTLIYGNKIMNWLNSFCPAFRKDLNGFQRANCLLQEKQQHFYQLCLVNLKEGQNKGFFLTTPNDQVLSGICYFLISTIHRENKDDQYTYYIPDIVITFLRGICTEKGLTELQQYANVNQVPQYY